MSDERKFKKGDRVRFKSFDGMPNIFSVCHTYTVQDVKDGMVTIKGFDFKEACFEKVGDEQEPKEDRTYSVGDRVRCLDGDSSRYVEEGQTYEVLASNGPNIQVIEDAYWHLASNFEPVDDSVVWRSNMEMPQHKDQLICIQENGDVFSGTYHKYKGHIVQDGEDGGLELTWERVSRWMLHPDRDERPEEIVQDVLGSAWERRPEHDNQFVLRDWILRIEDNYICLALEGEGSLCLSVNVHGDTSSSLREMIDELYDEVIGFYEETQELLVATGRMNVVRVR